MITEFMASVVLEQQSKASISMYYSGGLALANSLKVDLWNELSEHEEVQAIVDQKLEGMIRCLKVYKDSLA